MQTGRRPAPSGSARHLHARPARMWSQPAGRRAQRAERRRRPHNIRFRRAGRADPEARRGEAWWGGVRAIDGTDSHSCSTDMELRFIAIGFPQTFIKPYEDHRPEKFDVCAIMQFLSIIANFMTNITKVFAELSFHSFYWLCNS